MKFHSNFLVLPALAAILSTPLLAQDNGNELFSQAELDQMLAPIALYPDVLLSQVLIAATYPLEVVEASRWSQANPELEGDEVAGAVEDINWDTSVKTLLGFPDLIKLMDENLTWTRRLGDAFLIQEEQVMETVQNLRAKALETGNLASLEHVNVEQNEREIIIEPSRMEVVYVPYYSTRIVYGDWWWPNYPPVYWYTRPAYHSTIGFSWSRGFRVSTSFYYTSCDWRRRNIVINHDHRPSRIWQHEPVHRKGVQYRNQQLLRKYDRKRYVDLPRRTDTARPRHSERQITRQVDRDYRLDRDHRVNTPRGLQEWAGRDKRVARREALSDKRDRQSNPSIKPLPRREALPRTEPTARKKTSAQEQLVPQPKPLPRQQARRSESTRVDTPAYTGRATPSIGSGRDKRVTNRAASAHNRMGEIHERSRKSRIDRRID